MESISRRELRELASLDAEPAISIYKPLHRTYPLTEEDPIRFRNLLDDAELRLLERGMRSQDAREVLARARRLQEHPTFWRAGEADGLAVLIAPEFFRQYRLSYQCPASVDVGERFYIVPLVHSLLRDVVFNLLALSPKQVRLYRCNSQRMQPVELPQKMPKSLDEMYGGTVIEKSLQYHTSGGFGITGSLSGTPHGHGDPRDDTKQLLDEFFHVIAKDLDPLFRADNIPLIVAAVERYQPMFRKACHFPELLPNGVVGSPDELTDQEIIQQARLLALHWSKRDFEQDKQHYRKAERAGTTSTDLEATIRAADEGRISVLIAAAEQRLWGKYNSTDGRAEFHELAEPGDCDLLDFAVRETILHNGAAYVVNRREVPGERPLVAILRW